MAKPIVKLTGMDGNAFSILARCRVAAKKAAWTADQIDEFTTKAMAGDYDHLLATTQTYFEVR